MLDYDYFNHYRDRGKREREERGREEGVEEKEEGEMRTQRQRYR